MRPERQSVTDRREPAHRELRPVGKGEEDEGGQSAEELGATRFVGVDWAAEEHAVSVLESQAER